MLVVDENMFKLAKMQESLLKATHLNRDENLKKYIKTVVQIDTQAFAELLEETKHIGEHNQSLEEELQFLEGIKSCYDQLLELQLGFKRICELYGNDELKLSDLSQFNIEYIENRINTINGYLINIKNIEINKERTQKLGEQLVFEEKKRDLLSKKLLDLEDELKRNFINAEGRFIVNGELQYISVVSEYEKLEIDFERLLSDTEQLEQLFVKVEELRVESSEKLNAAQLCYDNAPSVASKQILDEIRIDALKVKYRLTMLKMLRLLSLNCDNYDDFKEKRENILDLIERRLECLSALGVRISIDPFGRTKISEQLRELDTMTDNSKIIHNIRKEISQLTDRIEEMSNQNTNYLILLSDTRNLIESRIGISDIDVSMVDVPNQSISLIEPVLEVVKTPVDNQVVSVREVNDKLNMHIVRQKAAGVVKRVNQMVTIVPLTMENPNKKDGFVPELVIVPRKEVESKVSLIDNSDDGLDTLDDVVGLFKADSPVEESFIPSFITSDVDDEPIEGESNELMNFPKPNKVDVDLDNLFETVNPFVEPTMFSDKVEKSFVSENSLLTPELESGTSVIDQEVDLKDDGSEEKMPELFWTTEEVEEIEEVEESFDDQINKLLATDTDNGKVRKLAA